MISANIGNSNSPFFLKQKKYQNKKETADINPTLKNECPSAIWAGYFNSSVSYASSL